MPKPPAKKKTPRRPLSPTAKWRILLGAVGIACTAIVLATGTFIRNALTDIDSPGVGSENGGPRIEGVNERLLEDVVAKNAARRDAARALPTIVSDPFGDGARTSAPSEATVAPPATEPIVVPTEETPAPTTP